MLTGKNKVCCPQHVTIINSGCFKIQQNSINDVDQIKKKHNLCVRIFPWIEVVFGK